jgi:hypothetical protein
MITQATLIPGKQPPVPFGQEAGQIWMQREKSQFQSGVVNLSSYLTVASHLSN